jgi:hypothetical protein
MMRAVLILLLAATVAGCSTVDRLNPFSRKATAERQLPYRAALRAEQDGVLAVTVKADGAGVDAVRESVRYPVTRHCLTNRGQSDADWVTDPATGDWAYTADASGNLTFRAKCRV